MGYAFIAIQTVSSIFADEKNIILLKYQQYERLQNMIYTLGRTN